MVESGDMREPKHVQLQNSVKALERSVCELESLLNEVTTDSGSVKNEERYDSAYMSLAEALNEVPVEIDRLKDRINITVEELRKALF